MSKINEYSLGLDFGTNSVRALVLNLRTGEETASAEAFYPSGEAGVLTSGNPHLARQNPDDYRKCLLTVVPSVLDKAREDHHFCPEAVIGIGVDATGSSPLPVDKCAAPLAFQKRFADNLDAQVWLWKDHTSSEEAEIITRLAQKLRPQYLDKYGGSYSSEWFFSKIWRCLNVNPDVFQAAWTWVELADYIPALLTGCDDASQIKRGACAAGHKAMFNKEWGGLPDRSFLTRIHPEIGKLRDRLFDSVLTSDRPVGFLSPEWAEKLGVRPGIPVAAGALDAHLGAVGSGIGKGVLVKIIGTSTCDILVSPRGKKIRDIPGMSGIADGSVLPGITGIEAGQSAVGDIFNWFVSQVCRGDESLHEELSKKASNLHPGESGLLALDWNNGNRSVLVDYRLTGLLVGQTLHTGREEIYRALIEATAFGARIIIERMEDFGVKIDRIINCGGIAEKNPLVMRIYADVLERPMEISASLQTCALGAAIMGGAAGRGETGTTAVRSLQDIACRQKTQIFSPKKKEGRIYDDLYMLYRRLHDAFGRRGRGKSLFPVMKELLKVKKKSVELFS
ncbi:MAG: ribulokinase [Candidatus Aminicenantes bacterium]|nr:ribulokinase [Candidatus Aminicenantes bacterium]